jgi:hypothetical protein
MSIDWNAPLVWCNNRDMTVTVMPGKEYGDNKLIRLGLKNDPHYACYVTVDPDSGRAYRGAVLVNDKFSRVENAGDHNVIYLAGGKWQVWSDKKLLSKTGAEEVAAQLNKDGSYSNAIAVKVL